MYSIILATTVGEQTSSREGFLNEETPSPSSNPICKERDNHGIPLENVACLSGFVPGKQRLKPRQNLGTNTCSICCNKTSLDEHISTQDIAALDLELTFPHKA